MEKVVKESLHLKSLLTDKSNEFILRNGMTAKYDESCTHAFKVERENEQYSNLSGIILLANYDDKLKHVINSSYDIMEIHRIMLIHNPGEIVPRREMRVIFKRNESQEDAYSPPHKQDLGGIPSSDNKAQKLVSLKEAVSSGQPFRYKDCSSWNYCLTMAIMEAEDMFRRNTSYIDAKYIYERLFETECWELGEGIEDIDQILQENNRKLRKKV